MKNNQWVLEPFSDLVISFSIIDTSFKRLLYTAELESETHQYNTQNVFNLSLANNFYEMLNNSKIILEYAGNPDLEEKISIFLKALNYKPNRIAYKQKIVADLYKYKKYYLD